MIPLRDCEKKCQVTQLGSWIPPLNSRNHLASPGVRSNDGLVFPCGNSAGEDNNETVHQTSIICLKNLPKSTCDPTADL